MMNEYFVDLHVHIGRTQNDKPVKISAARNLTFSHIAREASERKGIDAIGVIDCHSPAVQEEIAQYLQRGEMEERCGGGIRYRQTTILLGSELEVKDEGMGAAHLLAFFPSLDEIRGFTGWLRKYVRNVDLSSQRLHAPARSLQGEVLSRGGILIPAHIFTPFKSVYGSCCSRMADLLELQGVAAVELGLSADTEMAGYLSELDRFMFVTNSDAHSLGKIGREYNRMRLAEPSFAELVLALQGSRGRAVTANYGLNPRLGKYHRTFCIACGSVLDERDLVTERCLYCGSAKIVRGVMDRIMTIADRKMPENTPCANNYSASRRPDHPPNCPQGHPPNRPSIDRPNPPLERPPYIYQVPLEFIPGLGPKTLNKLIARFGSEMNVLHRVPQQQLAEAVGEPIANTILLARNGLLSVEAGGGGRYGRVDFDKIGW